MQLHQHPQVSLEILAALLLETNINRTVSFLILIICSILLYVPWMIFEVKSFLFCDSEQFAFHRYSPDSWIYSKEFIDIRCHARLSYMPWGRQAVHAPF